MLKFGNISEVDEAKGLARVHFAEDDDSVSFWLPMMQAKTQNDKFIIPFSVNEHVACLMDEQAENGVILGAIYDANNVPDGGAAGKYRLSFVSGLCVEYDAQSKTLSVTGTGQININVNGNVTVQSATQVEVEAPLVKVTALNTQVSGNMTVVGNLSAANISTTDAATGVATLGKVQATSVKAGAVKLELHTHTGVSTGSGSTGPPV